MSALSSAAGLCDDTGDGQAARLRWLATALVLGIVLAVPFFVTDVPPVLDYPNHLARYFVLAHPDDPALSQIYAPRWRILPNLAMDIAGAWLLQVVDVHVAGRVLLAISLFASVAGVIAYSRAVFGRFSYWPLASGAIAYNAVFFLGFMNFLLSLGLALAAAAAFVGLQRGRPLLAASVGAAAACVVFFAHIFGVMLFALLVVTWEGERLWRARSSATFARDAAESICRLALMLAPALLLFWLCPLSDAPSSIGAWHGPQKLWNMLAPFMTTSVNLTMASALLTYCFAVMVWRHAAVAPGIAPALLVLGAAFVLAPSAIGDGTFLDVRISVMMALLLFAGVQPRLSRQHAIAAGVVFAALIALRTAYIATTWRDSRVDVADLRAAIASVQPGQRVLVLRGHPGNWTEVGVPTRALPGIYRLDGHLAALLAIERRAFWPLMFANPAQQPLAVLPPYDRLAQPLAEPLDWPPPQRDDPALPRYLRNWRTDFDHVLLIDAPLPAPSFAGLTPVRAGSFAVLYRIERAPDPGQVAASPL